MLYKALSTLNNYLIPGCVTKGILKKKKYFNFFVQNMFSLDTQRDEAIFFYNNLKVKERLQNHQASCLFKAARAPTRKTSQPGKQQWLYLGEVLSEKLTSRAKAGFLGQSVGLVLGNIQQ